MIDPKNIRDMDGVYTNPGAVCAYITSYVLSKGDINTNKVSNKFCNIEVLEMNSLYYLAITSGRLGGKDIKVIVRRFNSKEYVKANYDAERKRRKQEGYKQVEVVTIYPNCSQAAQDYVAEHRMLNKEEAKEVIANTAQDKLKELNVRISKEPEVQLNPKVAEFVQTIFYEADMRIKEAINPAALKSGGTAFGMVTMNMVKSGRDILKEIARLNNELQKVKDKTKQDAYRQQIANLSNQYNSTIPRVLKDDWYLGDADRLFEQFELLDSIEIMLSNAVLSSSKNLSIGNKYKALNSDIKLVTDKQVLEQVKRKIRNEQLEGHHFKTKLVNVFEVNQHKAPAFDGSCGNVVSLFHGTGAANLYSILSTYIKLPQNLGSNVHITGRMFGSGVYFGQYSKALQYSTRRFGGSKNKGNSYYLFICDVALGKIKMETGPKNYAQAPSGYNSVMGVGVDTVKDGCHILGVGDAHDFNMSASTIMHNIRRSSICLQHNEFIIYNQSRFRIRYIVEVEEVR